MNREHRQQRVDIYPLSPKCRSEVKRCQLDLLETPLSHGRWLQNHFFPKSSMPQHDLKNCYATPRRLAFHHQAKALQAPKLIRRPFFRILLMAALAETKECRCRRSSRQANSTSCSACIACSSAILSVAAKCCKRSSRFSLLAKGKSHATPVSHLKGERRIMAGFCSSQARKVSPAPWCFSEPEAIDSDADAGDCGGGAGEAAPPLPDSRLEIRRFLLAKWRLDSSDLAWHLEPFDIVSAHDVVLSGRRGGADLERA